MGFFGKKKKDGQQGEANTGAMYPGAEHVPGTVAAFPTVAPDDNAYVNASALEKGINPENLPVAQPITAEVVASAPKTSYKTTTTVKHIPAPAVQQQPRTSVTTREVMQQHFRRAPVVMASCPTCCKPNCRTRIRTFPGIFTWVLVAVLLLLFWPICWIPLLCDICKNTQHYCTNCQTKVAEVHPFQDCCEKQRG